MKVEACRWELNRTLISESTGIITPVATTPTRKPALRPKLVGMVPGSKLTTEMLLSLGSLAIRFANSLLQGNIQC